MPGYPSVVFHVRQEKEHGVASLAAIKIVKFDGLSHIVSNTGQSIPINMLQFDIRKLLVSATTPAIVATIAPSDSELK